MPVSAAEFQFEANNKEDALLIAATVKPKRVTRTKTLAPPVVARNTIRLRPVPKSYISDKRFRVSLDLGKVAFTLKNGNIVTTEFIELMPIESKRLPEAQTYLKTEDKDQFTLQHSTSLFTHTDVDVVTGYDMENNVVFCHEHGNNY